MEQSSILQVNIPEFQQEFLAKPTTFYIIKVERRGNEWTLKKRYQQFDELNNELKKIYANLPLLPAKSLFNITTKEQIDKRRIELELYLKKLVSRTDVIASESFKKFFELEDHAPEIAVNPAKLILDMTQFSLGVRDFEFDDQNGLLFTGISDMNVASRVDSYLTNMKLPWEKELKITVVSVGAVELYIKMSETELKYQKTWIKNYPSQVISLYWDPESYYLGVGLDSGVIEVVYVQKEDRFLKYKDFGILQTHTARIMGLFIESLTGYIYSISEDKRFKVSDIVKNVTVADLAVGNSALTTMTVDKTNKRIFIGNKDGAVYIYDFNLTPPRLIHFIQVSTKSSIRGMDFDAGKNYLFTSSFEDGGIYVHDVERQGREKLAKCISTYYGKAQARYLKWSPARNEIYIGNDDGTVSVWNPSRSLPIYMLPSSTGSVTHLEYLEDKKWLLVSGKDRKLRIWELPDEWRDKAVEEQEAQEEQIQRATQNMLNFQSKQKAAQDDSDEDDLAGWHKFK